MLLLWSAFALAGALMPHAMHVRVDQYQARSACMPRCCISSVQPELIACKAWVENVVMGLNLCPWASPAKSEIRYVQTDAPPTGIFETLQQEMALLSAGGDDCPETTIVVCPNAPSDYGAFKELHAGFETLMTMMGMSADYQVSGPVSNPICACKNRCSFFSCLIRSAWHSIQSSSSLWTRMSLGRLRARTLAISQIVRHIQCCIYYGRRVSQRRSSRTKTLGLFPKSTSAPFAI